MKAGLSVRSSVIEPTTAISSAGAAAMIENRPTMRICRRDAAACLRQARMSAQASPTTRATRARTTTTSAANNDNTTSLVGDIGVSPASTQEPNVQVADFLPQRVAIEAQELGGFDLIAACGTQRRGDQGVLDLAQDAMIEAGRR